MVGAGKFGGFGQVGGVGVLHGFGQLFHEFEHVAVAIGVGLGRVLLVFVRYLLSHSFLVFKVFRTLGSFLEAVRTGCLKGTCLGAWGLKGTEWSG
jgi:hypothetical protein